MDINLNNLISKTKWDQNGAYNDAIEVMESGIYPTGCGATALAQLFAYHEFPSSYTRSDLSTLKSKWSAARNWDGKYDWEVMTAGPNISNLSVTGQMLVGALMYDVSKSIGSKFGKTGTISNMSDRINYLRKIGYSCDEAQGYSYKDISNSLHKNCPVMIRGDTGTEGHAWLIDGSLELERSRNYYVFWIPFRSTETQDYVHCNYGWSGSNDEGKEYSYRGSGYYRSGVFVTTNGDFSNSLYICTNLRPNR